MYKGVTCSIYSDKSILVIHAVSNILNIYNLHNCNNKFIIIFDYLFFLGLKVYLFTRDYWYESGVYRIECLSVVVDYSIVYVVVSILMLLLFVYIYIYNHIIIMISYVLFLILFLFSNSYLIVNSELYDSYHSLLSFPLYQIILRNYC